MVFGIGFRIFPLQTLYFTTKYLTNVFPVNNFLLALRSVSLPNSIEEAEFEGDPTLELISDEKAQELERPAWAKKIMSCVQPKGRNSLYLTSGAPLKCSGENLVVRQYTLSYCKQRRNKPNTRLM